MVSRPRSVCVVRDVADRQLRTVLVTPCELTALRLQPRTRRWPHYYRRWVSARGSGEILPRASRKLKGIEVMEQPPKASNEQRQLMKKVILAAITEESWPAQDVGQVLVSIGSAMLKGTGTTEAEFIDYARKTWAAQQSVGVSSN